LKLGFDVSRARSERCGVLLERVRLTMELKEKEKEVCFLLCHQFFNSASELLVLGTIRFANRE
jgi:hypothetical protein